MKQQVMRKDDNVFIFVREMSEEEIGSVGTHYVDDQTGTIYEVGELVFVSREYIDQQVEEAVRDFVFYCMTDKDAIERITDYGTNQLAGIGEYYLLHRKEQNE